MSKHHNNILMYRYSLASPPNGHGFGYIHVVRAAGLELSLNVCIAIIEIAVPLAVLLSAMNRDCPCIGTKGLLACQCFYCCFFSRGNTASKTGVRRV